MYISKERLYIWFSGGPLRILFEFKTNYSANSNVKEMQCLHSLSLIGLSTCFCDETYSRIGINKAYLIYLNINTTDCNVNIFFILNTGV